MRSFGQHGGFPKHQLVVNGERVLDRLCRRLGPLFAETIVVSPAASTAYPPVFVPRRTATPFAAPLSGSTPDSPASRTDLTFVVACDMPYVEPPLVVSLLDQAGGADVVVPVVRDYYEPLCAVYRRSCVQPIEQLSERGVLKVSEL